MRLRLFGAGAIGAALMTFAATASAATFVIRSTDAPGKGTNDPTVFVPGGGNTATTLGQARMNLVQEAGKIWGALLQSNVPIQVDVSFEALTCNSNSGTLGSAGPNGIYRNFGGGVSAEVYYVSALADALAGHNVSSNPDDADIGATFNSSVDTDPACLNGRGFYYGFDHLHGNKLDLLLVVLHEFGHGLGFDSEVNLSTGQSFPDSGGVERFDSFTQQIYDEQFNKAWPMLTDAERVQSATHTGKLAWNGTNVNAQISRFTLGVTTQGRVQLYAPATVSSGSSVSHFDTTVTPSVLMEPNLPGSITTSSTDITVCALQDIGWTVTVCPHYVTNHPPVATSQPQPATTMEDMPITITLTGTDSDNDPLTFAISVAPTKGTLGAIAATVPHTVVYTPNANANGTDSFIFTVNDGANTTSALVSITIMPVNDPPTVSNVTLNAFSGQSTNVGLLGSDIDHDTLTYTIVSSPAHGTLTGTGQVVAYKSDDGFIGVDTFTYRVNDGTVNSANATVNVNVQNAPQVGALSSSGGGGALTSMWVLVLATLALTRIATLRRDA